MLNNRKRPLVHRYVRYPVLVVSAINSLCLLSIFFSWTTIIIVCCYTSRHLPLVPTPILCISVSLWLNRIHNFQLIYTKVKYKYRIQSFNSNLYRCCRNVGYSDIRKSWSLQGLHRLKKILPVFFYLIIRDNRLRRIKS